MLFRSGYTIIDRNGAIYITGKCNLTVGNSVNIYVQGSADIQIDGETNINLNNNANIGVGGDLKLAVGGDIQVSAGGSIDMKAGAKFGVEAAETITNNAGTSFGVTAGEDVSISASGNVYTDAGGDNHMLAAGNINVDGTQFHGQEGAAEPAPAVEANAVSLTAPDFGEGKQDQFPFLTTPVRPSPPIQLKYAVAEENEALAAAYLENPDKFYNKDAAADGVKPNYAGTPKDDGQGKSLIAGGATSDIAAFLEKQLQATAQDRKSTRLNSSHIPLSRMPSSA